LSLRHSLWPSALSVKDRLRYGELVTLAPGVSPTAVSTGWYDTLAIGSSTPPPNLPEAPLGLVLPLLGASALGLTWWVWRHGVA
jgi:hypothetical protein